MLIGSFGRFWERDQVDWSSYQWRLLGRRGKNTGHIKIANFRYGRGVYVLYNDVGVYYVGLATGEKGIGGRLKDHLNDDHGSKWTRFSWFSFDAPGREVDPDHVLKIDREDYSFEELQARVAIRDLEALLQITMQPFANKSETKFAEGEEWTQVATKAPDVLEFSALRNRLIPEGE